MKKIRGFTMIELIVVMAIIGILAAILVPLVFMYVNNARIARLNTNARHIYGAANYSISDYHAGFNKDLLQPDCIYTGGSDRIAHNQNGSDTCDLTIYLGEGYSGYFGFKTGDSGFNIEYALWSESPINASDVVHMTEQDVKDSVRNTPRGCFPHKVGS